MTNETLTVLLPRAMLLTNKDVGVRPWPLRLYAYRGNGYRQIQIDKISYEPAWALASAATARGGKEITHFSGGDGTIDVDIGATDSDPVDIVLYNKSLDTECQLTLRMRAWAEGEG